MLVSVKELLKLFEDKYVYGKHDNSSDKDGKEELELSGLERMAWDIPALLKHATLAISKTKKFRNLPPKERAKVAWKIARHVMTRYGFYKSGSEVGKIDTIQRTARGNRRDARHAWERGTDAKNKEFIELMTPIIWDVWRYN